MPDIPKEERSVRERGTYAGHNEDPSLASYASSLFFLLSVPAFVGLAYAGSMLGFYGNAQVVPAFAGLLVAALVVVAFLMSNYRP